jgi:hypothetical protein
LRLSINVEESELYQYSAVKVQNQILSGFMLLQSGETFLNGGGLP